jgi:glycosyltransferase involved in cell wall biosynthesis
VSTDETLFTPVKKTAVKKTFSVFYYGNMLPLHGIQHVLDAAVMLQDMPIEFVIVGGKKDMEARVGAAVEQGARIRYRAWIDYKKLPEEIHAASLCLGGPFGATKQAELVVTGKTYQFLACQAPVLIGKNKATSLFKHQKNCLMAPLGDSAALAKQISWAYNHQDRLQEIAANGRQLYEKHFSISAISPQLEAVLGVQS